MRLFLPAVPHVLTSRRQSHCAFGMKTLNAAKMWTEQGFEVVFLGVEGSDVVASEVVPLMTQAEHLKLLGWESYDSPSPKKSIGAWALSDSEVYKHFNYALRQELKDRLEPGDVLCLPLGGAHDEAWKGLPLIHDRQAAIVETGIGYPNPVCLSRVYESHAWRHWMLGYQSIEGVAWNTQRMEWVIPNYYDIADWPATLTTDDEGRRTVVFLGRVEPVKGLDIIPVLARARPDLHFVICGQGEPEPYLTEPNIEYRLPIHGTARAAYIGNARAMICPSRFVEPFCGAAVESMLCFPYDVTVRAPKIIRTFSRRFTGTLLRIETIHGSVECTPEHPFYTDRGWVKAAELSVGDNVAHSGHSAWPAAVHQGRIGDLARALSDKRHPWGDEADGSLVRVREEASVGVGSTQSVAHAIHASATGDYSEEVSDDWCVSVGAADRSQRGLHHGHGAQHGVALRRPAAPNYGSRESDSAGAVRSRREFARVGDGSNSAVCFADSPNRGSAENARWADQDEPGDADSSGVGVLGGTDRWGGDGVAEEGEREGKGWSSPGAVCRGIQHGSVHDGLVAGEDSYPQHPPCSTEAEGPTASGVGVLVSRARLLAAIRGVGSASDREASANGNGDRVRQDSAVTASRRSNDAARDRLGPDDPVYELARIRAISKREVTCLPVFNLGTRTGTYEANGFLVHNCGTPVITCDTGGPTETVLHGETGFRCRNLRDYLAALDGVMDLNRGGVAMHARGRYSLGAIGPQYAAVFHDLGLAMDSGELPIQV